MTDLSHGPANPPGATVLFLTRSLGTGGAEQQLTELVRGLDRRQFCITVACFYPGGSRWDEVKKLPAVRLISLEKRGRWDTVGFFIRALRAARSLKPQVIYGFAGDANLVAWLLGVVTGAKIVWGVRRSSKNIKWKDKLALASYWVSMALSYRVKRIIYNSERGRTIFQQRGYSKVNATVIPNGFDTQRFHPDPLAGSRQREVWGIKRSDLLVGIVGRLNPVKDHALFIAAASQVVGKIPDIQFVCVGSGSGEYTQSLQTLAKESGLAGRIHWVGECANMVGVYNALDLLALCSKEEGCPNVVGEAMACGVPCAVTDVGDVAALLGGQGSITPPGDSLAMAAAWTAFLNLPPEQRKIKGQECRRRIVEEFSLERMVNRTASLLEGVLKA